MPATITEAQVADNASGCAGLAGNSCDLSLNPMAQQEPEHDSEEQ